MLWPLVHVGYIWGWSVLSLIVEVLETIMMRRGRGPSSQTKVKVIYFVFAI